jgi:5-amino-6-(5-phospho-D-ribitylamino)uracil phosphatase
MTGRRLRLAAIDLDGTLLNSQGQVSERNQEALRRLSRAGVLIAAATARWPEAAVRPFDQAGVPAAAIACAGADVVLADGAAVARSPMQAEQATEVAQRAEDEGWVANISVPGVTYRLAREIPPWAERAPAWLQPVTTLAGVHLEEVLSILIEPGAANARELDLPLQGLHAEWAVSYDGRPLLTVTAEGVNKGRGLLALCEAAGIGPEAVAAFGDSDVDLPMFAVAGTSVAMGNAAAGIQDAATMVTGNADADGFADAVDRLLGD